MKILLSAYACEPNKGSEPEVGWKWATELSKMGNDVYVITRLNNKDNIEKELKKSNFKNLNFIYFDFPKLFLKIFKGKQNKFSYFYFYIWQVAIFFVARKLVKKIKFDYIHHVTFVTYRIPSFLCLLNVPFIFGPVAGGEEIPKNLIVDFDLKSKFKEYLRKLSNIYINYSPIINIVLKKSTKIITTSNETKLKIPKKYHSKTFVELGISPNESNSIQHKINTNNLKKNFNLCFVGSLEHRKGINIILKVIQKLKKNNFNFFFNFYGDGPLKKKIKKFIVRENLTTYIKLHGTIPHEKVCEEMKKNHILFFPSLRDSGGFVLFEAMSVGLPSLILKLGGPANIIDNNCGIIIDPQNKSQQYLVDEICEKFYELADDENKLKKFSNNCQSRIKLFSWKSKIANVYGK